MSLHSGPSFSKEEIELFKPHFVKLISKTTDARAIREALGSDELYSRFSAYTKVSLLALKMKKVEDESERLAKRNEVLRQQLIENERLREESRRQTASQISGALDSIKVKSYK